MFFNLRTLPVIALGLTALSLATPTRRAPALEVSLSGEWLTSLMLTPILRDGVYSAPKSIESLDHAKVVATVTNTGSESVKILKYGTILDHSMPTKSFTITKGGKEVAFQGIKVWNLTVYN